MTISLKGQRVPHATRLVTGYSSETLSWMMEQGLAWRGMKPENWKPRPKSLKAWLFYLFIMLPRSV